MEIDKLSSAIYNDLVGGSLIPKSNIQYISLEQIADEVAETRCTVIKEWYLKNLINRNELLYAINCIPVTCADQNKCSACSENLIKTSKPALHFEIPELMPGLGSDSIYFIGSTDRSVQFKVYSNKQSLKYLKYKKRNIDQPYVYVERTPNANNMYDCWVFNAPFLKYVCVIGVFKDLRQLGEFDCCRKEPFTDFGAVTDEVKKRILQRKIQLYRAPIVPSPQSV